ncbi:MAG: hypothetical protein HND44_16390 [Chloroflexi bacterium]|nr:hypothetical protein [Ardenticatenaceae bacterium]MBL1130038.1 hypothetical protein [Chloroflexota bacterium]NOG36125.1 hypothetical protein [Chloroflexota bacterium]GIK57858.1 MAG: hypothetical protein BroJett015_35210 [Chloroflexota bacterium]
MKYLRCINNPGNEASLVVGRIYRMLPLSPVEEESGMVRVVDNEGEDYLYPSPWFEVVSEQELTAALSESVTVHLNGRTHIAVRDIANARGVSISSLVREWIDERLDLPEMEMS